MRTKFEPRPKAETAEAERRQSLPIRQSAAGGHETFRGMRTKFEPRLQAETGRRGDQSPHPPCSQLMGSEAARDLL
jgi:hypothetical protein